MKRQIERVAAERICNFLIQISSQRIIPWAEGLRSEVSEIRSDREALHYAISGLAGLLPRIILGHTQAMIGMPLAVPGAEAARYLPISKSPQKIGVFCAVVSTLLGVLYLAGEGAPLQYVVVNLTALVVGLAALALVRRIGAQHIVSPGPAIFLMAALVLLTSLLGRSAEGAARWIDFGPVTFQTSLLVLPAALVLFARSRSHWSTIGVAVLALAEATQPDRAMACALFIGLSVIALHQYDRRVALALGVACIAACVTLAMPDPLSPAPYVDGVFAGALASGPVAALLAIAGVIALLGPAIGLSSARGPDRTTLLTFLSVWSVIGLAAAVGNFPTPFVGYGASSIVGYLLCLAALPERLPVLPSSAPPETAVSQSENENGASISVESRVQNHARPGSPRWLQLLSASCLAMFGMGSAAGQAPPDDCGRTEVEKVEIPNTIWQPGPGGEQIPLWPDDVKLRLPDYDGNLEMTGTGSPLIAGQTWSWATYISRPTMTIYAPKGENTGAAMLVLPGGGYAAVAMDLEGTEICDWITQHGVTCIVLKYRVPQIWRRNESGSVVPPDNFFALEDAQRAMSLLRDGASAYRIDPQKIGVIGFSAGAHLAAALSNVDERTYTPVDAVDNQPTRPDFAIVLYPGRFLPPGNVSTDLSLGSWVEISAQAPPTLLFHAMNDSSNDVRNSIAYGLALDEVGVPVDMRFFAGGCHAFGLRPAADPIATDWPVQAVQWLGHIGIL